MHVMDYLFASWHHQDSFLTPPLCGEEQLRTIFYSMHFPLCFWDRITHENVTEYLNDRKKESYYSLVGVIARGMGR